MNFSFWPFLWFGLLGRLLILVASPEITSPRGPQRKNNATDITFKSRMARLGCPKIAPQQLWDVISTFDHSKLLAQTKKALWCPSFWGEPKQPMKLQQPRNYDIGMFQFNLLGSQGSNSREMTTSPPGHHWEATVALTTAAKLQKVHSQQPWNDESETQQGAWDFASFHGCCRFKCLLGFSEFLWQMANTDHEGWQLMHASNDIPWPFLHRSWPSSLHLNAQLTKLHMKEGHHK